MIKVEGPLTVWRNTNVYIVRKVIIESQNEGTVRCPNCLLTNSFINAHTVLPLFPLKGIFEPGPDYCGYKFLDDLPRKVERAGVYIGIWENILAGNTVIYSPLGTGAQPSETLGVELHTGPIIDQDETLLIKTKRSATTYFLPDLTNIKTDLLKEASELVKDRVELQICTSQTKDHVLKVKKRFGQYPIRMLRVLGLLSENTMLVHSSWLTKTELEILHTYGSPLVHTPIDDMKRAVHGFFPWKEAREKGIKVLFGTGSSLVAGSSSIARNISTALLWAGDRYWEPHLIDWRHISDAFDKRGTALWKPMLPVAPRGKKLVNLFVTSPELFKLEILVRKGRLLFPREMPAVVRRSVRTVRRTLERMGYF